MGSVRSEFQEAIGLNVEAEVIECRASDRAFSTLKLPFMSMYSNVILKKGVLANDNNIFDWFSQLGLNTIKRETVTICLLDETEKPTMVWTLSNAFSVKLAGTEVSAVDNETAVETIELAHTGITITNGWRLL